LATRRTVGEGMEKLRGEQVMKTKRRRNGAMSIAQNILLVTRQSSKNYGNGSNQVQDSDQLAWVGQGPSRPREMQLFALPDRSR
jgi:hypothetical protein